MKQRADIVIIGGGVIGCAIAYQLRKAGIEVLVIEKNAVAAEASSAAAGLLAPLGALPAASEAFTQLVLASWSLAPHLMREIEEASSIAVEYARIGGLHLAYNSESATALQKRMADWIGLGAEVIWLTQDEIGREEPLIQAFGVERFQERNAAEQ